MSGVCEVFDYRFLGEGAFETFFHVVLDTVREDYKIVVAQSQLPMSVTGDFDGERIVVRADMSWEMKLFILLHLFGHTVQFCTSEQLRKIGMTTYQPQDINDETLRVIRDYEQMAGRYGLWLLHKCRLLFLDQWASDWSNGDLNYLVELYTTGKKYELTGEFLKEYKSHYIKFGSPSIKPLAVPNFLPKKWESRFSF